MVNPAQARRQVIRKCKSKGFTVHPDALEALLNAYDLDGLLERLQGNKGRTISLELLETLDETPTQTNDLQVISAFETPCLEYTKQMFGISAQSSEILGSVQHKLNVMKNRFELIQQRVLRNKLFRPQNLGETTHKITNIASLLGSTDSSEVLLLAVLVPARDSYVLEDQSGQIPVNLHSVEISDDSYVFDYSILLVEGHVHNSVFQVLRVGQPLPEPRRSALKAIQQHVTHSFFQCKSVGTGNVVILRDVDFQDPQLEGLLAALEVQQEECLIIIMGKFNAEAVSERFEHTKHHVAVMTREMASVYPVPAQKVDGRQTIGLSNPCRIHWGGREIFIADTDVLRQWPILDIANATDADANERLVSTLLGQSSLCLRNTYWCYDHALSLYPPPDCLVLGGRDPFVADILDVQVIQADAATYGVYNPLDHEAILYELSNSS